MADASAHRQAALAPPIILALVRIARVATQALDADAVAEWFDADGDGLAAAVDALDALAAEKGDAR